MNDASSLTLDAVAATGPRPYPPAVSQFTLAFWQGLRERRFITTCCQQCGKLAFPPKPFCPHCWHREVKWQALSPRGVVYSATTVHAAPLVFRVEAPYQVGIVDLQAGLRIATRLLGGLSCAQAIGKPVELVVLEYEDGPLFAARVLSSSDTPTQ